MEKNFARNYDGSDGLNDSAKIVAVMEGVFRLSDREEGIYVFICMNAG